MPSVSEGLGLVMLEAMAAGCPVIVTDLPAVRSVIRPGENGLLFPERDAAALAQRISEVLRHRVLASRLAAAGYREVETHFAWSAVADNHRTVYAEAMGAP